MPTKVLYAVLNWGLGHASRSIPIIKLLLSQNIDLVIASDGEALVLLQKEFPEQTFETLPAYNVHYSEKAKDFDKTIFLQLNKLGKAINEEHRSTKALINKHQITHIISDNRYGVYSAEIHYVIVCHQMTLMHKNIVSKTLMNKVHFKLLIHFNEIWVPDFKGENALAGNISKTKNKKLSKKIRYIKTLSRMQNIDSKKKYSLAIVLSGPEPQRSILEEILVKQLNNFDSKVAFVRGISSPKTTLVCNENVSVFDLLKTDELNQLLNASESIICRAGYSSIMDLAQLNKPALLIPTPGQTEQEYLAKHLEKSNQFVCVQQSKIDLINDLKHLEKLPTHQNIIQQNALVETINKFLSNFAK